MRTLSAGTSTALSGPVTNPVFFVKMEYSTTLYLCSRGDTIWNGQTWQGVGLSPAPITVADGGILTTSIDIADESNAFSTIILGEPSKGISVSIWAADAGSLDPGDPEEFFLGETDGAVIGEDNVVIGARSDISGSAFSPRQIMGPPVFNHIPPSGTVITWGDEKYVVESI